MISWVAATHNLDILYRNLVLSLLDMAGDELVVVQDAPSIAAAYNEGQARAKHPIRCFVHHDVEILDLPRLRAELNTHVTADVGMVGLIGSRTRAYPWWDGRQLGSVFDQRIGELNHGPGGECLLLDGVLLATVHDVGWDETIPGWHGYDHDACEQMLHRGLPNFCLTAGHEMVRHNASGSRNPEALQGFHEALNLVREKWGAHGAG
jgi:hypothetical protein